jgi:hypothetical protein
MLKKEEEEKKNENIDEDDNSYVKKDSNVFIYSMGAIALVTGYIFMQLNMMSYQNKTSTKEMKVTYSGKA